MSAAQGMEIIASGDARCDSPGHNATFGTYSIMDTRSKLLIAQETVRVTEVKNSYWMEVGGLKRCLNKLFDHGVAIATLATDRHPSVRKTMEDDYNTIRHEYDLWHIVKSVKKRLLAAKKADLTPWGESRECHRESLVVLLFSLQGKCSAHERDVDIGSAPYPKQTHMDWRCGTV